LIFIKYTQQKQP